MNYTRVRALLLLAFAVPLCAAAARAQSAPAAEARAPKFSSVITNLSTQCRPSEDDGTAQGEDRPLRCEGYGDYVIHIDFSAATSHLRVQLKGGSSEEAVYLADQPLDYDSKRKVEWRLADGVPFAIIFRVEKPKPGLDPAEMWLPENKAGESLRVKGLGAYAGIDFEVDAKTPNANARAREMADAAYAKPRR